MLAPHNFQVRIYYEDTDLAGIVYYANYLRYIERARTEMLRAKGIIQSDLKHQTGIVFVVRRCTIDYLKPAKFDDLLHITTTITALKGASLEMEQVIWRDDNILVTAFVTLVSINADGKPIQIPAGLRALLSSAE